MSSCARLMALFEWNYFEKVGQRNCRIGGSGLSHIFIVLIKVGLNIDWRA